MNDQTQITFSCENCGEDLTVSVQMGAYDAVGLALETTRAVAAARARGWEASVDGPILCPTCVRQLEQEAVG